MAVDYGITWLLKEKAKINKYAANTAGFCSAVTSNYYLNRQWTFQSANPDIAGEYLSFAVISLIGLLINTLILWIFVSKFKRNFYLSKFFAILVTAVWNFSINFIFTFNR